jgi:hypothetical protein
MLHEGRGPLLNDLRIGATAGGAEYALSASQATAGALLAVSGVPYGTTVYGGVTDHATGKISGDFWSLSYLSLARCALVDNGANYLQRSETYTNAAWTATRASAADDVTNAPDNTVTVDALVEDSSTNTHFIDQSFNISSSVLDYAFTVCLKAGSRTWAAIQMIENTGVTAVIQYVNLSTGALGTSGTGANWASLRSFSRDLGGGWYAVSLVARKTNAANSLTARIYLASADNTSSYTGNGSSFIRMWRSTLAPSSVPTRLVQTTSSANTSGTVQSGSNLHTKGWPVSTSGLLLTGDWFEINGELKQLTAPVSSDAAGLAYMQFRPGVAGSPADNDPVIVQEPFGRFIYPQGVREIENLFGIYGDCEMNLEEIYA